MKETPDVILLARYATVQSKTESFIHVDIVSFFLCNSCVAPTLFFEWNEEVPDLTT